MLNIEDFSINKAHWPGGVTETAMVYVGKEYIYYITEALLGGYYKLTVSYLNGSGIADRYSCSSLSVAIANIEALERGEEI